MGIRNTERDFAVAIYDSATGFAFGPTFESGDEADAFLQWTDEVEPRDIRDLSHDEWYKLLFEWSPIKRFIEEHANTLRKDVKWLSYEDDWRTVANAYCDVNGAESPSDFASMVGDRIEFVTPSPFYED